MNKRIITIIAIAIAAVTGVGCGDAGRPDRRGLQGWWMSPPDSKGDVYECFYWSTHESTSHWCKPDAVAGSGD